MLAMPFAQYVERRVARGSHCRIQHVAHRLPFERIGAGQHAWVCVDWPRAGGPRRKRIGIVAKVGQQVLARGENQRPQPCQQQRAFDVGPNRSISRRTCIR